MEFVFQQKARNLEFIKALIMKFLKEGVDNIIQGFLNNIAIYDNIIALTVIDAGCVNNKTFNQMCVQYKIPVVNDKPIEVLS